MKCGRLQRNRVMSIFHLPCQGRISKPSFAPPLSTLGLTKLGRESTFDSFIWISVSFCKICLDIGYILSCRCCGRCCKIQFMKWLSIIYLMTLSVDFWFNPSSLFVQEEDQIYSINNLRAEKYSLEFLEGFLFLLHLDLSFGVIRWRRWRAIDVRLSTNKSLSSVNMAQTLSTAWFKDRTPQTQWLTEPAHS